MTEFPQPENGRPPAHEGAEPQLPEGVVIADRLRGYMTPERLAANALGYDVMRRELSPTDERRIAAIRERLLGIPLLHGMRDPAYLKQALREGLLPYASTADEHGNSGRFDADLGLDEYVFANWGVLVDKYPHFVVVDARAMLEGAIVTPKDAVRCGTDIFQRTYSELSDAEKVRFNQEYFDKMVTGSAWLEIMARQVYEFAERKPESPFPVPPFTSLGEVKLYGKLDPGFIIGDFGLPEDSSSATGVIGRWDDGLLKYGIAVGFSEATLRHKAKMVAYDPEGLKQFQQAGWQEIMGIE